MAPGDRWFFDRIHPVYDLVMPPARSAPLQAGLALVDGPVDRVLDVGGGTGRAARALDARERTVLDASSGMLRRVPAGIGRVLGSATDLPVADETVDAIVVVDALHHLPEHDRVLAEAFRALRPGGALVIRDFNRATLRGRLLKLGEHAILMESTFVPADELAERLETAGFEAHRLGGGFTYTVAGRKPGRP